MSSSPNVVFKVRYYQPSDASLDASNPINVDKINKRNYYSSNAGENDFLKYIDDGIKRGNGFDYMDYMTSHDESSGVFCKDGLMTAEQKKEVRNLLRKTKSVIWDALLSFSEDYGKEKIKSWQDAMEIVKQNLPKFLKENGLDENNVIWFAGLHRNTDNLHIHISFFELEPTFNRANKKGEFYHYGPMKQTSINNMKVNVEEYMNGSKYFFESYRRNLVSGTEAELKGLNPLDDTHKKIKKKLAELFHKMPKGKLGYGHKSMESLRPLIDEIASLIMSQNPSLLEEYKRLKKDLEERDLRVRRICESQHIDPERYMLTDKYLKDFNRRVGNKIIEYAKKYELDSKWEGLSYEKQALMRNRIKRNNTLLFKSTATLNKMVAREADKVFTDFRKRLKEAEYQRLVEEGVIEAE